MATQRAAMAPTSNAAIAQAAYLDAHHSRSAHRRGRGVLRLVAASPGAAGWIRRSGRSRIVAATDPVLWLVRAA
jgi:hypothetical protein